MCVLNRHLLVLYSFCRMNVFLYPTLSLLLALCHCQVESEFEFQLSSGIYFKQHKDVIFYEHSLPLLYDFSFEFPTPHTVSSIMSDLKCGNDTTSGICLIANHLKGLHEYFSRVTSVQSIPPIVKHDSVEVRRKKRAFLSFVGDIFHWCCAVARNEDTDALFHEQDHIQQVMDKVKEQLRNNNLFLQKSSIELKQFQNQIVTSFDKVRNFTSKFVKQQQELGKSVNRVNEKLDVEIRAVLLEIVAVMVQIVKFSELYKYDVLVSSCRNGLLHPNILPYDLLKADLRNFNIKF
mgnify:CR=1 FL=1